MALTVRRLGARDLAGGEHVDLLERELDADVLSLDSLASRLGLPRPKALAQADLAAVPSAYEGCSVFVNECVSCAVPLVGPRVLRRPGTAPYQVLGAIVALLTVLAARSPMPPEGVLNQRRGGSREAITASVGSR